MDKVRWGVLGCARIFENRMIPGFKAASDVAEVVAIASRSPEKARLVAERNGIPKSYGSYQALLGDPDVEVVYVPLPNDQHAGWIIRSLEARKHVLCEKPMALHPADAVRAANAADAAGLRLMEGFMYRHHPQHARIAEICRSGEVGDIVHFGGTFTYLSPFNPGAIRWNTTQGGGALLDVGVYTVNAARYHFGAEPIAVSAASRVEPSTGVDWHTSAILEWEDGRTASLLGGFDQCFTSRYEVRGSKGIVSAERAFQIGTAGVDIAIRVGDDIRTEFISHIDQYGGEIAHFSACVHDAAKPLAPGENGVAQARVVEAIRRAAKEKRRVELTEVS